MFFTVSGGPFGLEGLVGAVGPGVAVLLLVATPVLYSVPETLLIGELASMLPAEGGYYQWVKRAFGRFWGFWNGWLSWTYSLLDMAIYPVLFIQYLRFFAPGLSQLEAWLVALALIWGATWLNLRGTVVVGTASGWFVAMVLLPFGVLAGVAIARWLGQPATPFPVTPFHAAGSSFLGALGLGVSQSIWNYSGWDNASTIGGEIEHAIDGTEVDGAGRALVRPERLPVLARRSRRLRPGRSGPRGRARALAALAAAGDLDVAVARPSRRPPALADRRVARRGHPERVSSAAPGRFAAHGFDGSRHWRSTT